MARALRETGLEVVTIDGDHTPVQLAETVIEEDADAIGLAISTGAHGALLTKVAAELETRDAEDVLVFGRIVTQTDPGRPEPSGTARIFGPDVEPAIMTGWLEGALDERERAEA